MDSSQEEGSGERTPEAAIREEMLSLKNELSRIKDSEDADEASEKEKAKKESEEAEKKEAEGKESGGRDGQDARAQKNAAPAASPKHLKELNENIAKLDSSIQHLLKVFKTAGEIMMEEQDSRNDELANLLKQNMSQNKEIAKGIIAVADLVKEQSHIFERAQRRAVLGAPRPYSGGVSYQPATHNHPYDPQYHLSYDRKRNHPDDNTPPEPPHHESGGGRESQGQEGSQAQDLPDIPAPASAPKNSSGKEDWDIPPIPDDNEIPEPPQEDKGFFSRFKK